MHHAPRSDVAPRGGAEPGEVAAEDLGACLDRIVQLRLFQRDVASLGTRAPERRLVVVEQVRADACAAPGSARLDPGEPVLALEVSERFGARHRTGCGKCAHARCELLRGR